MILPIITSGNEITNINIREKYTNLNTTNIKAEVKYTVEIQYSIEGANNGLVNCINIKEQ